MTKKATAIPGGGGGCWLGGPKTATSDNYGNGTKRMSKVDLHGTDLFGETVEKKHTSKLGDEFLIPPFSVFSAREGWWQERKRAWLALGIQSELGRGQEVQGGAAPGGSARPLDRMKSGSYKLDAESGGGGVAKGLTWGDHPGIAEKGLNYYRKREGRDPAAPGGSKMPATNYSKSKARGDGRGRAIT
jgi:hypothetical protein